MPHQLTLSDGQTLDYSVSGATDGIPMIYIHGTPGAYIAPCGLGEACQKAGIKLFTYSRPGYGGSSRQHGRRIVDEVKNVEALKRHLGLNKFLVGGWSGGGQSSVH